MYPLVLVPKERFYRYTDRRGVVLLEKYDVLRHTRCGVWIDVWGEPKFVNTNATKQWACATEASAKISFLARKARQRKILQARLEDLDQAVIAMNEGRVADYSRSAFYSE